MSGAINDLRMGLWMDVVTAYASASNSRYPEQMGEWADKALELFDKKFGIESGMIHIVQHKETLIVHGAFDSFQKANEYICGNTDVFAIQKINVE